MWSKELLEGVPETYECNHLKEEGLTGLFYSGVPYKGRETRVFAWIGLPEGASPSNPVPGIVLVHGGGGTAFSHWVRYWNRLGYAAISMDTCGSMPPPQNKAMGGVTWPRHDWSGPNGWGGFDQMDEAPEDQWAYHAVHAISRGHSLLASMPEVDADRTGITGVSWGGVLTCLSASLDHRYKCAAPVYGCGYLVEDSCPDWQKAFDKMGEKKREFWRNNWDPAAHLAKASCPILWYNGSNDFTFHPNSWQKSTQLIAGESTLCMKLRWPHGHGPIGEEMSELPVFMNEHLKGEQPYPKIIGCSLSGRTISAEIAPETDVFGAQLVMTLKSGNWPEREWHTLGANYDESSRTVSAEVPDAAISAYLQVLDKRGIYVTSERFDF